MKIIYVMNTTSMGAGSNKSFLGMLETTRKHNDVVVITPDDGELNAILKEKGVRTEVIRYIFNIEPNKVTVKEKLLYLPRYAKRKIINWMAARKLTKLAKEFGADLIHANTCVTEIGDMAARRLKIPHLAHVREYGMADHQMVIPGLKRRLHGKGRYTICITRDIAKYHHLEGLATNKVIYNPVVNADSLRYNAKKEPHFLYAGRVDPTKGIADMIEAYILYRGKDPDPLPLWIAGSLAEEKRINLQKRLKSRLNEVGLGDEDVVWLGERKDINDLYSKAVAVCVPSLYEGFGRVMPEAQANGALVIARDTGGSHEQLENGLRLTGGEIGLRFANNEEFAECLLRARRMSEKNYSEFVNRSQKAIAKLYSVQSSGQSVEEFYENLQKILLY